MFALAEWFYLTKVLKIKQKKLYRVTKRKMFTGLCTGASYLMWSAGLVYASNNTI